MKLKERIRIAWQVLTKGTCDELERADLAQREAVKAAEIFEDFLRDADVEHRAVLTNGTVIQRINLLDTHFALVRPSERPYYASSRCKPPTQYLYTLHNVERKFAWEVASRNADIVEYYRTQAVHEIARALIREGIIKTEVQTSPDDYNVKRIRCWVPYYRLENVR